MQGAFVTVTMGPKPLKSAVPPTMSSTSPVSRRAALRIVGLAIASVCIDGAVQPAYALKPGKPSKSKLLNEIRDDRTAEEIEAEKERIAEERKQRIEKQKELQAAADRRKAGLEEDSTKETEIESNLRGQYYYPTARKRYLPRVKLAWETIPSAEDAARNNDWTNLNNSMSTVLNDAVLPMKLYASSLAGGGLNISSKFIEGMSKEASSYEQAVEKLKKAAKKKESGAVLTTLVEMKRAIERYRELGRLKGTDFGIGEVPQDMKIGSGFANNNSALYNKNKAFQGATTLEKQ